MSAAKNTVRIQRMCVAALLCAIAILIPMISPVKDTAGAHEFHAGQPCGDFHCHVHLACGGAHGGAGRDTGFLLAGFPPVVVLRALSQVVFVAIGAFLLAKNPL